MTPYFQGGAFMTQDRNCKKSIKGTRKEVRGVSKDTRREFLSGVLASSAALAGLGLLAETLGAAEPQAVAQRKPFSTELRGSPVKLRSLENGLSLEVSSKELAQHLVNEGIVDPKHRQGVATVRYDLVIS
jgi:hypothetical protein